MTDSASNVAPILLDVRDLRTFLFTKRGIGRAVDGVSFAIRRGETLGLVGESGSGKSVTALSLMGLHPRPAARIISGTIQFDGHDVLGLSSGATRRLRGSGMALILQDALAALNPVLTVGAQIGESLELHQGLRGPRQRARAVDLLRLLQVGDAEQRLGSYPHQLSGGTSQRVLGAIAFSGNPRLLIADEPTTSLDVTVQANYLALLRRLQRQTQMSILFVTHDFGIVARMCDRVAVMYAGRLAESAPTEDLFSRPSHPYTVALLNAVPDVRRPLSRLRSITGQAPSVFALPEGCRFHPRCWLYEQLGRPEVCRTREPGMQHVSADHEAACHFAGEGQARSETVTG